MTEQELKLWNEFNDAYNAEFKNLPFDSADEEFLFKRGCWWAWQASRAAVVVNLPITVCRTHVFELPHTNEVGMEHDEYFEVDDIKKSLAAAGVKYK